MEWVAQTQAVPDHVSSDRLNRKGTVLVVLHGLERPSLMVHCIAIGCYYLLERYADTPVLGTYAPYEQVALEISVVRLKYVSQTRRTRATMQEMLRKIQLNSEIIWPNVRQN
jgi:hypothetical protein